MQLEQSRRDFLASIAAVGSAGFVGARVSLAAEGAPEVTTIRLSRDANICLAPGYIAEDLLRTEGFIDIRYVADTPADAVARGQIDFEFYFAGQVVAHLDAGWPITALAGIHSGCYELFAHDPIRTIIDLKGRRVGIRRLTSGGHLLLTAMAAHVGLNPHQDIEWVVPPSGNAMEAFAKEEVDAFIGFPPEPQELRARNVGRVILSTATDRPWSQYLCCIVEGNRDFVRAYPVATKRFLRATLKATDMCATDPAQAAQRLIDGGFAPRYDYALQTLTELPYDRWREFEPEDTMRFYALRLHEAGMIQSSPNALIAEGTDWRFLNELKRELKA